MKYFLIFAFCFLLSSCVFHQQIQLIHIDEEDTPLYGTGLSDFYRKLRQDDTIKNVRDKHIYKKIITNDTLKAKILSMVKRHRYYKLKKDWFKDIYNDTHKRLDCFLTTADSLAYITVKGIDKSHWVDIEYCIVIKKILKTDSVFIGFNARGCPNIMKYNKDYYMVEFGLVSQIADIYHGGPIIVNGKRLYP